METIRLPDGEDLELSRNTLLLVDDEENILSSLRRLFRKDGYRVLCAGSGEEGLKVLESEKVDVILSDQRMPHMLGTSFLRRAREKSPHSVRMILSGYTDLDSVTDAINEGAVYKFLTKPWDDELLRLAVREALQHKWTDDENRMLQGMLLERNDELEQTCAALAHQADETRNASRAMQNLLDAVPLPLMSVEASGAVRCLNTAATELAGRSDEFSTRVACLPTGGEACGVELGGETRLALCRLIAGTKGDRLVVILPENHE